jgi:hypothetical protein
MDAGLAGVDDTRIKVFEMAAKIRCRQMVAMVCSLRQNTVLAIAMCMPRMSCAGDAMDACEMRVRVKGGMTIVSVVLVDRFNLLARQ